MSIGSMERLQHRPPDDSVAGKQGSLFQKRRALIGAFAAMKDKAMGISPLSVMTTAAAGLAASRLAKGLKEGPSFLNFFAQPAAEEAVPPSPEADQAQNLQSIGERISQLLATAGVKTSLPFSVKVEGDGTLRVRSLHPQKDRIEAALNADGDLAGQLNQIASSNPAAELRFQDGELVLH